MDLILRNFFIFQKLRNSIRFNWVKPLQSYVVHIHDLDPLYKIKIKFSNIDEILPGSAGSHGNLFLPLYFRKKVPLRGQSDSEISPSFR